MSNWPRKPPDMPQSEYDYKVRAGRDAHRIYTSVIEHMLEEALITDPAYRDHAFGLACIMIAEHVGRIMGGQKKLAKQVADATDFLRAMRKLNK